MFIKALSVTQITDYIKKIFVNDLILNNISIIGEISNFKHHYSGHMYFTLKDNNCKLKCSMFKNSSVNLKFYPEDGMSVIITGRISIYEKDGQYQIYVDNMQPDGKGALHVAFEQLKKRLEFEGLFNPENKIKVPRFPMKIGVVTSATGAAVQDIINVTTRRYPGIEILIVPVAVQGIDASHQIADAIELLNKRDDIDVIITGRGGGSIEELWAFNEEIVARAIYKSRIPIISAVGHETDFTIADFVSDLRAPTPSAAAELCVPDKSELIYKLNVYSNTLHKLILENYNKNHNRLTQYKAMIKSLSPVYLINQKKQYLDSLSFKLISLTRYKININKEILKKCSSNLESLSPLSVISRGYSITYISDTKIIVDDIKKVTKGNNIDVMVKNGTIKCCITSIREEELVSGKEK